MTTENNILSTFEDIVTGTVRPLSPLPSIIKEYILNGHTEHHEDIREAYDGSVGYTFAWGQIIEARWTEIEAATISLAFRFGDLLTSYQDKNNHLDALSDIALMSMRRLTVPRYLNYDEGDSADVFAMYFDMSKEKQVRKWLATRFLRVSLNDIFTTCEKYSYINSDLARAMYQHGVEL